MKLNMRGFWVSYKQLDDLKTICDDLEHETCTQRDAGRCLKFLIEDVEMENDKIRDYLAKYNQ